MLIKILICVAYFIIGALVYAICYYFEDDDGSAPEAVAITLFWPMIIVFLLILGVSKLLYIIGENLKSRIEFIDNNTLNLRQRKWDKE